MRFDRELILLGEKIIEDDIGNQNSTETRRSVLCQRKSIGRTEFYAASSSGLKPEFVFVMYDFEYRNERKLEFEGIKYSVIRTYSTGLKEVELTCEKVIGNG